MVEMIKGTDFKINDRVTYHGLSRPVQAQIIGAEVTYRKDLEGRDIEQRLLVIETADAQGQSEILHVDPSECQKA